MATEQKIGVAFVQVMAKGIAEVQTGLNSLKAAMGKTADGGRQADKAANQMAEAAKRAGEQFDKLAEGVQKVGVFAQRAFLVGSAAIGAFIRTADPVGFERMQGTLGALSVQIGSIFLPLLDQVQKQLSGLLNWFRSLTDAQKSNILHWVEAAGAILAVAIVIPKLILAFQAVSGVITGVVMPAIAALGTEAGIASGGILPLVGVIVTAAIALGVLAAGFSQAGQEAGAFASFLKPIKVVVDKVIDLFNRLGEAVKPLLDTMGVALAMFGDAVGHAFDAVGPVLKAFVDGIVSVVAKGAEAYRQFIAAVAPLSQTLWDVISKVLSALAPLFAAFASGVFDAIGQIIDGFTAFIQSVAPVLDAVGDVLAMIGEAIANFITLITPLLEAVGSVFGAVFGGVEQVIQALYEAVTPIFEAIRDAFDELTAAFGGDGDFLKSMVDGLAGAFKMLAGIVAWAFKGVAEAIRGIKPVFESVFGFINGILEKVIKSFIYWSTLLNEVRKGNLTGAASEADKAVADYEKRLKDVKHKRAEERKGLLDKPKGKPDEERHAPTAQQKPELIGITEAWKKAQTASQSPQDSADKERNKLLEEQLKKQQEQIEIQRKIKEALDKKNGDFGK